MKLWMLGSGSSGNSVLIETERSRILVDAGFSPRVLKQRLTRAGVAPDSIEAVVVTHEHTDHVKGVASAARKWGWTIVSTAGTRMMCPEWSELRTILTPRKSSVVVGDFHLETVPVPHDASEPIAVIVTSILRTTTKARSHFFRSMFLMSFALHSTCTIARQLPRGAM